MKTTVRQFAAQGFTLIELLIVVIIIAIMAAIAIPQFGNSTAEATDAALDANLNTVRSAIELYRVQHNNKFPGLVAATAETTNCPTGQSTELTANTSATFVAQLTQYSNRSGQVCKVPATGFDYGPYLRAIPRDPVTAASDSKATDVALVSTALSNPANATTPGWQFSTLDGRFQMNSNGQDRNKVEYYKH
jgi:general secretion pathway protein G